jgi:hypothetical protein
MPDPPISEFRESLFGRADGVWMVECGGLFNVGNDMSETKNKQTSEVY